MECAEARPVAGVDYQRTYQQLQGWFPDNSACLDYLTRLRWPAGFVCPACESGESWRTKQGLRTCRACGRKTSVTAGTIFHRTRTPLSTWFAAIWFVTSQKNGDSAQGLQRVLGFGSYETAWAWMHKLRRAMVRPDRDLLAGVVELDDARRRYTRAGYPGWEPHLHPDDIAYITGDTGATVEVEFTDNEPAPPAQRARP